jgi:hypothetical protein
MDRWAILQYWILSIVQWPISMRLFQPLPAIRGNRRFRHACSIAMHAASPCMLVLAIPPLVLDALESKTSAMHAHFSDAAPSFQMPLISDVARFRCHLILDVAHFRCHQHVLVCETAKIFHASDTHVPPHFIGKP